MNPDDLKITKPKSNTEFYDNCSAYFTALRENGKNDFGFEDEYFYTLPAIYDEKKQ